MIRNQKRKPTKPTKKMTQAEQSARFKETARQLGVDESGKELVFNKIVTPKKKDWKHR